jgi:6-phosphofructokinase 1
MRTIGVLTSGGDAPGMNAAIRAVVRGGILQGLNVVGIGHGYQGLVEGEIIPLEMRSVSGHLHRGGTLLATARSADFMTEQGFARALATLQDNGIDGLAVIGGDGSYRGALELAKAGIHVVGLPGTIDNDIPGTEYTIGFDTAVNTCVELSDKLRDTAQSHERCSVIEVMGRHCGNIALAAGLACGATAILVPEITVDFEQDVLARIDETRSTGKRHFILIVSEGVFGEGFPFKDSAEIAGAVTERLGIPARTTVLGHVQRGGNPSARDRIIAAEMGYLAAELLSRKGTPRAVCYQDGRVCDRDLAQALAMPKPFDFEQYRMAMAVSG